MPAQQMGAGVVLPTSGTVFVSIKDEDKDAILEPVRDLVGMDFEIVATRGTAQFLEEHGVTARTVNKVLEGNPHIVDSMIDGNIQLVFNTTEGAQAIEDSFSLRRTALMREIPYYTTRAGAHAVVRAISALRDGSLEVAPLQSYFKGSF